MAVYSDLWQSIIYSVAVWLIKRVGDWVTDRSTYWLTGWQWLTVSLTLWEIEWLTDSMTEKKTARILFVNFVNLTFTYINITFFFPFFRKSLIFKKVIDKMQITSIWKNTNSRHLSIFPLGILPTMVCIHCRYLYTFILVNYLSHQCLIKESSK